MASAEQGPSVAVGVIGTGVVMVDGEILCLYFLIFCGGGREIILSGLLRYGGR